MAPDLCSRSVCTTLLLYAAILAGVCFQTGDAEVECYVCSFNPYEVVPASGGEGAENGTSAEEPEWWQLSNDTCSWEKFDPSRTRTAGCDRGCEIVKMTDGNGELEMFYRNCLTRPDVTYSFKKTQNRLNEEEVYTCNSRLCNGCDSLTLPSKAVWTILLIASLFHSRTRS
ncbi:uncharacterized protein LOC124170849 [Ischnura elegans]|uniref:uncharacterized protein LOC124170849 n=1 Tax=Ischnura elegans TaxID=197161 RepID=UPI001ED8B878|nr:uncharacterized protein LOC124170849 [Ischnura elegans]